MTQGLALELPRLLAKVEHPGDFFTTGAVELPIVQIAVDGVGTLGLPVPTVQAEALARLATPAPYGRGLETVVDPTVRNCGQIAADAVHAKDARWQKTLNGIVTSACTGLGVHGDIEIHLYKLLVYGKGAFFREHRDTEKAPGMFATLVVVLPSMHQGGDLVVQHDGRTATLQLCSEDPALVRWAAFFTDCEHELRDVTDGFRLVLVYNLVRRGKATPKAPQHTPHIAAVARLLQTWPADGPVKLVVPLKHKYSLAELAFATLKNSDSAIARVLVGASAKAACELRLAMVSIAESGMAEPEYNSWSRRSRYETPNDRYRVIEVSERTEKLQAWRTPDDAPTGWGDIDLAEDELAPPNAFDAEKPDEDALHEASGNEGATFERTYRRAALVLWPTSHEFRVLDQGGPGVTLPTLEAWLRDPQQVKRAVALANAVVNGWPRPEPERRWLAAGDNRARLLRVLAQLPDRAPLRRFVQEVIAAGAFDGTETDALVAALSQLGKPVAAFVVKNVVQSRGRWALAEVAQLLEVAATAGQTDLVRAGLAVLPDVLATLPAMSGWERPDAEQRTACLVHGLRAAKAIDDDSVGDALVLFALENPTVCDTDAVLIPAAKKLRDLRSPATMSLQAWCVAHLERRVAILPQAPTDARRSAEGLTCTCKTCAAVKEFLVDPTKTRWELRAVEQARRHVQLSVGSLDVTCETLKQGSPYTLILRKNQASYDRKVEDRQKDIAALRALLVPESTRNRDTR